MQKHLLDVKQLLKQVASKVDLFGADQSSLGLGYDFGAQNAFISVCGETDVSNKPVTARGTWFQKGNSIRAEADVKLDSRQKVWGT